MFSGGILTVNGDNTKFDISDGAGDILSESGVFTLVEWTGLTA